MSDFRKIQVLVLEIVNAFRPADVPFDCNRRPARMRTILKEGYFISLGGVQKTLSI
jgi:hypothetical protein